MQQIYYQTLMLILLFTVILVIGDCFWTFNYINMERQLDYNCRYLYFSKFFNMKFSNSLNSCSLRLDTHTRLNLVNPTLYITKQIFDIAFQI